jgi:hypothetical protein
MLRRRTIDQRPEWVCGEFVVMGTNRKAMLQRIRPRAMNGIVCSRMARRPSLSIQVKANRVKRKFVRAMVREVPIGERKPMRLKIVAEKYMRQFCE